MAGELGFEWDPKKAKANEQKHGIRFEEARTVFFDPLALTISDPDAVDEERYVTLGQSESGRMLVVVSCERGDNIRIISARPATRRERKFYEQAE
jgi:uncharacterized DUF497 family protein